MFNYGWSSAVNAYSYTEEQRYTQFGDYITGITPTVFIAKFLDMRIQNWDEKTGRYGIQA